VRDVQLPLDLFGEEIAGHRDVACERRHAVGQHVDIGHRGTHVDQNDGLARGDTVVDLEHVLQAARLHVHHHRLQPRLACHVHVVVDRLLLRRHQQDVHLALRRARRQHLHRDVHVADVERDVLLRLPLDRLVEFLAREPAATGPNGGAKLLDHAHRLTRSIAARGVHLEPAPKLLVQRRAFPTGPLKGGVDQPFVGAEGDVSHDEVLPLRTVLRCSCTRCSCMGSSTKGRRYAYLMGTRARPKT
jgi:hypothetical protein